MYMKTIASIAAIISLPLFHGSSVLAADDMSVEVLHFNTSGSEAASFYKFKDAFEKAGGKWIDSPVAGGGGDAHDTTLRARVLAGDAPGAALPKCPEAARWYEQGYIANIDEVAAKDKWDDRLPEILKNIAKVDGHYVCVPYDIHRLDWLWGNAAVLKSAGIDKMPETWADFDADAKKIQAQGKIVLAHGGQEWQDGTTFQVVALSIGGADYFRSLAKGDTAAIDSKTTRDIFDRMRILSTYVDRGAPGRDWNLASAMVTKGDAAFQIMGDWAKGEFLAAGKKMGTDILCAPVPGNVPNRPGMDMVSNSMGFFVKEKGNNKASAGQKLLASTLLTPDAEIAYTMIKGSVPSVNDVPLDKYDTCAQRSVADIKANNAAGTLVGDMWTMTQNVSPAIDAAIRQVSSQHFSSKTMTSDDAVKALLDAVDLAK
jgi:glucose/mannose transport system substrate-binding protein